MDTIFISYSKKDAKWLDEVKKHLSILEHKYQLVIWDDTKIKVGYEWYDEIISEIKKCKVAILLVSNNFLASKFIQKKELPQILNTARLEGIVIFNVILDTCAFNLTDLNKFQCLNDPKIPLEVLRAKERKSVLVKLTTQVKDTIDKKTNSSLEIDEVLHNFSILIVLAILVKAGPRTITGIWEISLKLLERKTVVSALNKLQSLKYIDKIKGDSKENPTTLWRGTALGLNTFTKFEKMYTSINNSIIN